MNAPTRLYLTSGGQLCAEDHPDAAELLAPEGQPIDTARLHREGLTLEDVTAHVEGLPAAKPEEQPAPEAAPEPLGTGSIKKQK